jgi:hypothetical protein
MDTGSLNSRGDLEHFRQLVLEDDQLLEQLRQAGGLESFAALAVALGQQRGCAFTSEQVRAAVQEARRAWLQGWI